MGSARRGRSKRGRTANRSSTLRRFAIAAASVVGTALAGVVVADVYRRLTEDDGPSSPVSVVADVPTDCPNGSYVLPAARLDTLPPQAELNSAWVREHGGFDDHAQYALTVQGTADDAVVLHRLRVIDVVRGDAPAEPVRVTTCFGGGDLTPRRFEVDLDAPVPKVRSLAGDLDIPEDRADPPVELPYTVSVTDPEVFWVTVANEDCYCTFELELDWTSGGRTGTTRIDLDGGPFAVAPFNPDVTARYDYTPEGELVAR